MGRRRVLDSTALYDAVATMDTVTLVRSAIRGLLKAADSELAGELRAVLGRDDDYVAAGKPVCDYDDPDARAELVDALARDGMALLAVLDGRELTDAVAQAAALLATVLGQDLDRDEAGVFRIAGGSPRPGDLHRGSRDPARAQDRGARFRRLQGACRHRPRHRDHHRHHGERR